MVMKTNYAVVKRVAVTEVTALCKKQTTLEDIIASVTNYFHTMEYRKQENLLMRVMSRIMP